MALTFQADPSDGNFQWTEGAYDLEFAGYDERDSQFGPAVLLYFHEADDKDHLVSMFCSVKRSRKAKLTQAIMALAGVPFEDLCKVSVVLDEYVGRRVRGMVENRDRDGEPFSFVAKIRPLTPQNTAKQPSTPVRPDPDDDVPF